MGRTSSFLLLLASAVLIGCTAVAAALVNHPVPGYGVNERMANSMGCDLEQIEQRGKQYRKESYDRGGPGYVIPNVGDSGCDVLAKLGRPNRVETIQVEGGGSMNFWYRTGSTQTYDFQMHLVVLEPHESLMMVVKSVVW